MRAVLGTVVSVAAMVAGLTAAVPSAAAQQAVEDQLFVAAVKTSATGRTVRFVVEPLHAVAFDSLAWNFGDGTSRTGGSHFEHTYPASPDSFTVTLTARFTASGQTRTVTKVVQPDSQPPQVQLTAPPTTNRYGAGDLVQASATGTDPEGGPVEYRWVTAFHDCPGTGAGCPNAYLDPVLGTTYGVGYPEMHPMSELGNPVTVSLIATDSAGISSTASFQPLARLRALRLAKPVSSEFTVDGRAALQSSYSTQVRSNVTVVAPASAYGGAAPFERWTDGVTARTRQFTMPDSDLQLTADYLTPIEQRYRNEPALRSTLGAEVQAESGSNGDEFKRYAVYQNGRLHWSPTAGTHEVHGAIAQVGTGQWPITDELGTPDGIGRYNHFENGWSVYWSPNTGAHSVHGPIRVKWAELGWERGLGYPTTEQNELYNSNGSLLCSINHFSAGAAICWTPSTGARELHGAIYRFWHPYWWPYTGAPTTDEMRTPDGVGRYNHFVHGYSIYWSPSTGAHEVHGAIRTRWAQLGWEWSYLGYPTSDEFGVAGGRRSNFQYGYIVWNASTGQVTDRRY